MALTIEIKVVPQSGKYEWQLNKNGILKCFLKSAAEKGAANKELIKTLSKQLKIPQQDIEIVKGLIDRNKVLKIHTGIDKDEFLQKIGISEKQNKLF
jgi:uncharacterized protein (TIGR00251 family)